MARLEQGEPSEMIWRGGAKRRMLREESYRILGVDLTTIPGISVLHTLTGGRLEPPRRAE
jgi:hypothetical protein